MRIIAGKWRGRRLASLGKGDDAARLRPTPDRVRESLFSMLQAKGLVEGARVLDLFAGTGALGLEALSRGAVCATFVESGRVGKRLITQNIQDLKAESELLGEDVTRLRARQGECFDLVFLDPPYGKELGEKALVRAAGGKWLAANAHIVWEEGSPKTAPSGFDLLEHRQFGGTFITFLRFSDKDVS